MKIFLDFDSTLNNIVNPWLDWIYDKFGERVLSEELTSYDFLERKFGYHATTFWKTPGVYDKVQPLFGALEFVESLRQMNVDEIKIITSSPEGMQDEKNSYLKRVFGFDSCDVIHSFEKFKHTSNSILVDDYDKHILTHISNNKSPGILFNFKNKYGWSFF